MITSIRRYITLWRFKRQIKSLPITKVDISTIELWLMIIKPEKYKEINYRKLSSTTIRTKHSCDSFLLAAIETASKIGKDETHKRLHPLDYHKSMNLDVWFTTNGQTVNIPEYLATLNRQMNGIVEGLKQHTTHAAKHYHQGNAIDLLQTYHLLALALYKL